MAGGVKTAGSCKQPRKPFNLTDLLLRGVFTDAPRKDLIYLLVKYVAHKLVEFSAC